MLFWKFLMELERYGRRQPGGVSTLERHGSEEFYFIILLSRILAFKTQQTLLCLPDLPMLE